MVVRRTTRLQFLVVRPTSWLSVLGIYKYTTTRAAQRQRWVLGTVVRRTTASVFLVVPGARTTNISNAGPNSETMRNMR